MTITVNTNIPSLMCQNSMNVATSRMNKAMEKLTTGLKINRAADDAAGLSIVNGFTTQIRGSRVCQNNIQQGINMLQTGEGFIGSMEEKVNRMRDLAVQGANDTYSDAARDAILKEMNALVEEIDQISASAEFNGVKLLDANFPTIYANGFLLQVGPNENTVPPAGDNQIDIAPAFGHVDSSVLFTGLTFPLTTGSTPSWLNSTNAQTVIDECDKALAVIADKRSNIGACQNRLESKNQTLATAIENYSAARSTILDTDVAVESSNYIREQILQQASATLLATANQAPSIALSLI